MKARWQKLAARFDAFSRRERGMIAAAVVGGGLLVGLAAFVDPVAARNRTLRQNIESQSGELASLQAQVAGLEAQLRADPDAGRKAEIEGLKAATRSTGEQLEQLASGMVPPEQMNALLGAMLQRHPGLKLVSLKTRPPTGLLANSGTKGEKGSPAGEAAKPREFDLFRHGVEIRLEGAYADLHAYLAQLEQGPQKLLWGEARLSVGEHPKAILTLVVYTLNSDKAWLAI